MSCDLTTPFELLKTGIFEKDIKTLDGSLKLRLKKAIEKIMQTPQLGKPLKHNSNTFSERIENRRLIYRIQNNNQILLVCFKHREEVYEFLKTIN